MTPKESFDKFLNKSQGSYLSPWEIWKEATRQAYEDAARICETNHILNNLNGPLHTAGWELAIKATAETIRQRAKEYDNEET